MKSALRRLLKGGVLLVAAALIAACQAGAPGKAGADGADGAPGDKGDTGPQGQAGVDALAAKKNILPIAVADVDATTVGTTDAIDAAALWFRGGHLPRTYALATAIPSNSVFVVEVDKDTGMVTITARATGAIAVTEPADTTNNIPAGVVLHYGQGLTDGSRGGTEFAVTATDAMGNQATTSTVSVRRNRAPVVGTEVLAADLTAGESTLTVGTQADFGLGASEADKMNPCSMLNVACAHVRADSDRDTLDDVHFADEDAAGLMFSAMSKSPEVADVDVVKEVTVGNTPDNRAAGIMVTGLSAGTAVVELSAEDSGMLMASAMISTTVTVDPAPTLNPDQTLPVSRTFKASNAGTAQTVLATPATFFKDNGTALQIIVTVMSDPFNVLTDVVSPTAPADLSTPATEEVSAVQVNLTGNTGSAEIEIKAREVGGLEQYVAATVTVNVE